MARDRRSELIDAGVALTIGQRFQDLLASVDTRSITERAGVTTGSFFHHFRNRGDFAAAVAERFVELWIRSVDSVVADMASLSGESRREVRDLAQTDWDKVRGAAPEATLQHLLWAAREQPVQGDGGETGGEVLGRAYGYLLEVAVPAYRKAFAALGREVMPPFDEVDFAVTMTALIDGIQMRQAVQPEAVRDGLFADLVAGSMIALTRPLGEQAELVPLEAGLARPVRLASRAPHGGQATWRQIADAAAPLFVDQRVRDVKVVDVAAAAGVSPSTVHHHFRSVAEVAACSWARYVPELEAIAAEPLTAEQGPIERIEQVLTRIVQLGKANRGALEGLVLETVAAVGGVADADHGGRAVADAVPLAPMLAPLVRELRLRGRLRRRIDSTALARSILQLVAMRVLATPDDPVERIVDDTFGLVLEGALVGGGAR